MFRRSLIPLVLVTALGAALLVTSPAGAEVLGVTVAVDGMACPFCAYGVEKKLKQVPGVGKVDVDLKQGTATLTVRPGGSIALGEVPEAIRDAGFTPGRITVVAAGRVVGGARRWLLDLGGGEQLLLVNLSPAAQEQIASAAAGGTRVRVSGKLHFHRGELPGLEPEAVEQVAP